MAVAAPDDIGQKDKLLTKKTEIPSDSSTSTDIWNEGGHGYTWQIWIISKSMGGKMTDEQIYFQNFEGLYLENSKWHSGWFLLQMPHI